VQWSQDALEGLSYLGIPFAIATTNGKPRVPLALMAAGLSEWFR
jgi:phosphoglycolate phosphatase-like HAD superfamily hydrolase